MYWIKEMQNAIGFIEDKLLEELSIEAIANSANSSSANFQRIFSIVTGMTVGDYIRARRLSLAGQELANCEDKVLDVALKYGYETAASFTKAFVRFHGVTPSDVMRKKSSILYFAPLTVNIDIRGGFRMSRKIIPHIPEVGYYGNEVDYVFNLLEATFAGAGENIDKAELAVYSGIANRLVWKPGDWNFGYEAMDSIDQAPFETKLRLLKTFGWDAKYIKVLRGDGKPLNTDNEQIRRDFVESIDKGYPVMYHVANHRHYMLIGYENDGSVIVGKGGIDGENDEKISETIIQKNWEETISEYILLKEKSEPVPERERFLDLLKLIVSRARRTDKINGMNIGFAAWEAYLHDLEFSDFSKLSLDELGRGGRMGVYCDGLCQIWERSSTLPYYKIIAERYPEWREELAIAVDAMDVCAKYGGFLWQHGFGFEGEGLEKFRSAEGRKILADEGRKAMKKDMEAIEQFERILDKEGVPHE